MTLSSSATRRCRARPSSDSTSQARQSPTCRPPSSIQFRSVAGFRSNSAPTCRRAANCAPRSAPTDPGTSAPPDSLREAYGASNSLPEIQGASEPITRTLSARKGSHEAQLRDSSQWETMRHDSVNFKPGEVELPRLEVAYVSRRTGAIDNAPTKVPFALLISIKDMGASGTLCDEIRAEYGALVPVSRPRGRVRARGGTPPHWS